MIDDDGIHRGMTGTPVSAEDTSDRHMGVTGPPVVSAMIDQVTDEMLSKTKTERVSKTKTERDRTRTAALNSGMFENNID